MNAFMTTQFLYTLDAWMFHIQKANQYIKHTHQKILMRTVNKHHETSFNGVLTIRQQFSVFNNKIFRNFYKNC